MSATMPTTTPEAPAAAPVMPYRVEVMTYGLGRQMPTKVYPHAGGEVLTPDEVAVWGYVQHLEARALAAEAERDQLRADLEAATAPQPVPEKKGKGK